MPLTPEMTAEVLAELQPGQDLKINLEHITVPGEKMLVQELDPESVTPGGIVLPDMSKQRRAIAKVLKLGAHLTYKIQFRPGAHGLPAEAVPIPAGIPRVGDYVTYGKYVTAASEMEEIGPRVCVLNFDDVLAVLKPEAIEHGKEDRTKDAPPNGSAPNPLETRDPSQENGAGHHQGVPRRD
jgi:co-chaperonin GroES (HSP10)